MPKYRVTDPTSGKTLTLTGDSPPSEQELEEVFSSYASTEQPDQPELKTGRGRRPAAFDVINELGYNPYQDPERTSGLSKWMGMAGKPYALALKGLGMIGQVGESAIANPMIAVQQAKREGRQAGPLELLKASGRAFTGEQMGQFGDVGENEGLNPMLASTLGVIGSSVVPGPAQASKLFGSARAAAVKSFQKTAEKAGHGLIRAHLGGLIGKSEGAVERGIEKRFSGLLNEKDAWINTLKQSKRARVVIKRYMRKEGELFDSVLNAEAGKNVPVTTFSTPGTNSLTQKVKEHLSNSDFINAEGELVRTANPLGSIVNTIDKKINERPVTIGDLRGWLKDVRRLSGNPNSPVRAAASQLDEDLREAIANVSPDLAKANARYSYAKSLATGSEKRGFADVSKLLAGDKATRSTGLHARGYSELTPAEQATLGKLETRSGTKFVDKLKDADYLQEFAPERGGKTGSVGFVGQSIRQLDPRDVKPEGLIASILASTIFSPAKTARFYRNVMKHNERLFSPKAKAFADITARHTTDPLVSAGARRAAISDSGE